MRLQVFDWGRAEAPPVVCVHGATGHGQRFQQLVEERWAHRFRVFAVDLRGHGRSGWHPPWTIETHVGDLLETINALGLRQPDWVGHSFGGRLVVELAAREPGRIRRTLLLDPAIQLPGRVVDRAVAGELREPVWESVAACFASRDDTDETHRHKTRTCRPRAPAGTSARRTAAPPHLPTSGAGDLSGTCDNSAAPGDPDDAGSTGLRPHLAASSVTNKPARTDATV